jgi:hypothetical protein
MNYLTSDEIAMIFERWLSRRVPRITEPTKFFCTLVTEPGFGSYLHVCTDMSQHKNFRLICGFEANTPNDRPTREFLKDSIEKNRDFLPKIKQSDYESELKEAKEHSK